MRHDPNFDQNLDPVEKRIRSNPCEKCRKMRLDSCKCTLAKGKGTPGSSGSGSSQSTITNEFQKKGSSITPTELPQSMFSSRNIGETNVTQTAPSLSNEQFNPAIILDLIAKKILIIDENRDLGIFKIKCNNAFLSPAQKNEVKKFVNFVQTIFDNFKTENHLSEKDFTHQLKTDDEGNIISLKISFPAPTLFDAFITQLHKKVLPLLNIQPEEVDEEIEKMNKIQSRFNPFNIDGPKPRE